MEEEDHFYQEDNNNNNNNNELFYFEKNNEYEDDNLINISIELLLSYQDYCKDEAIPIGESLRSIDLFEFIKYGYEY